mgnify:CR=1 FL=1
MQNPGLQRERKRTKKKIVCYTCCTGGYDDISQHNIIHPDWDYVYFTDNKELIKRKRIGHWEIRPLEFSKLTNVKNARWHKINTHILFPEYEYSLWLDANIVINSENVIKKVSEMMKDNVLLSVPLHPERTCIYQEAEEIIKLNIDFKETVNDEINFLKKKKFPANMGLHETCIIFKRHNKIKRISRLWWKLVKRFSKRDQLSFDYTLWKYHVYIRPFYEKETEHRTNGDFLFQYGQRHDQNKINQNDFNINNQKKYCIIFHKQYLNKLFEILYNRMKKIKVFNKIKKQFYCH